MKVLQANKFFFINGGSETVMFQERDYLKQNGHQVVDFSMRDERNFPSVNSVNFVGNRSYKSKSTSKLAKLADAFSFIHSPEAVNNISHLIEETEPDVVHCHNIYHQLTPSIIGAAKRLGVPVVLTLHDSKPVCPTYYRVRDGNPCSDCIDGDFFNVVRHRCVDGSLGKSSLIYAEAVVQRLMGNYEKVDAFIAPSRFMQESVAHRIPPERIKLLYNGIDTNDISVSGADDGYVLFLGRLVKEKGIDTLLKAHANSSARWRLVVAGTGPLGDVLKVQYNPSILVGYLAGDALKEMIDKASLIVVPSEIYENCPMSVLEAMAYGKPVVGSRLGGTMELVEEGKTGLLFEAGNVNELTSALDKLMASSELRRQLGEAGRKRVEAFYSLDKHNAGLMEIYKSVLGV
ncbi:glycosyltransferase family 4 protein [Methylotenera sp.]|uniref:glycosyltransferase family 4 protein n=1 Tax=Methylotenera sp. TaxID=2051956 RepID=UPI00273142A1|nr:glycosyltransferase family 4 protein [Methylotenera sp.]MDP2229622.1 glycosyltransferase family 4 protein [Methylotenera sp.]